MRCEYCRKIIHPEDVAHGLKYGSVNLVLEDFIPAKDSAWTIICDKCGEKLYRLIYSAFGKKSINPTLYKIFTQTR